jgi:hypothetical protein
MLTPRTPPRYVSRTVSDSIPPAKHKFDGVHLTRRGHHTATVGSPRELLQRTNPPLAARRPGTGTLLPRQRVVRQSPEGRGLGAHFLRVPRSCHLSAMAKALSPSKGAALNACKGARQSSRIVAAAFIS